MDRRKFVGLMGGAPGWVRSAYGANVPDVAAHFDEGRYWVDGSGYKAITDLLAITRASTKFVTNAAGLLIPVASGDFARSDLGLLIEEARTNVVLWNRDLTNVAWAPTDITAAKDQTGADGTANAASSLTATGANGTILQSITLASSARWQSVFVKRITGTGTIEMTMDNGTTWTAIVPTANYQHLSIPTQTLANPIVGFRIVTSGDAIAVDFVQNENGAFKTSPIATTTVAVARAADVISLAGQLGTLANSATFSYVIAYGLSANSPNAYGFMRTAANAQIVQASNTTVRITAGSASTTATIGGSGNWLTDAVKIGISSDGSNVSIVANNGTVATGAGIWAAGATNYLGSNNGSTVVDGYVRRLAAWTSRIPDTTLKTLTA